jgi:N-acetylmuramoyl-L-alanine amidase
MIYLEAGHVADITSSNYDPGACSQGFREADIAKLYRDTIANKLRAKTAVVVTDCDKSKLQKVIESFKGSREGDVVLSIHLNAGPTTATGVETFYPLRHTEAEKNMAFELSDGLSKIYGIKNRGIKDETLTQHKSLGIFKPKGLNNLVELGFITNKNDLFQITDKVEEACTYIANVLWKYELMFKPDGSKNEK